MPLRAVIFGLEGILIKDSKGDQTTGLASEHRDRLTAQVRDLFEFLRQRSIRPIVLSNRDWVHKDAAGHVDLTLDDYLHQLYGEHTLYVANRGGLPRKPTRACIQEVLRREALEQNDVIMVGMSQTDFQTAINSNLLFLNAVWDRQEAKHGFVSTSPSDIKRFIDLFALKDHYWFYKIDDPIRFRSLAPFSTLKEDYSEYSAAARQAAKQGTPERHFFLNTLVASLYFTGLINEVQYIACVPRHQAGYGNPAMDDVLAIAGGIFRKRYIRDLIVRHTTAPSQRAVRIRRELPKPETQLNTMHLTLLPLKNDTDRFATPIKLKGKTVLVFDDFCTNGYSLEATRIYLEQAGARPLLVSWLKTINSDYRVLNVERTFNPFGPAVFAAEEVTMRSLPYWRYVADSEAPTELREDFERFSTYGT